MRVLITGGAGFVGCNLAAHFLERGDTVVVLDNLSRAGTPHNLRWLQSLGGKLEFLQRDIRDPRAMEEAVAGIDACFHLAAQVAVTTSVRNPREDFEINILGTVNLLEALRTRNPAAPLLFTSTNKVYGKMAQVPVVERNGRYEYADLPHGVSESMPLDFYSPYGCSKGGADQYVIDYARIFGLRTVVFRMSCIYGERQMGCEDQGWVAHFLIQAARRGPITIYGDGKQVRDVLHVADLVRAFERALERIDNVSGQAFNIGGGPENTLSLLELLAIIESEFGVRLDPAFDEWRPGDQKVYVSGVAKAERVLGWRAEIDVRSGLQRLYRWIQDNSEIFQTTPSQ
jgi:CDP-paratose 2-epimerase